MNTTKTVFSREAAVIHISWESDVLYFSSLYSELALSVLRQNCKMVLIFWFYQSQSDPV